MGRVIYAIPFTSIIEQTADVFRGVFSELGVDAVLEHHSNLDPEQESRVARLATQNWDSPIVVTTNVQLLESLYASRTSKCRKLHRVAGSVIIFDEVQTLPIKYLEPCLAVIRELVDMFACSVVLCTATQPAITRREEFPIGLSNVREIIDRPAELYRRMRRVKVERLGFQSDESIAERIANYRQSLCIVNTRPHALALFELVRAQSTPNSTFHLSTFMCAVHRKRVLDRVRKRLCEGKPCRVISTQLIEAGVDIDFPIVFRALTGLDSIAQAAGRCNREGLLERGNVFVFVPASRKLLGYLKSVAQTAGEVMPLYNDVLSLDAIEHYFRGFLRGRWGQSPATRLSTILRDVQYIVEAHFELICGEDSLEKHSEMFRRRAGKGQYFHHPYLGCREFPAHFEFIDGPIPKSTIESKDLGFMLHDIDFQNDMTPRFYGRKSRTELLTYPDLTHGR